MAYLDTMDKVIGVYIASVASEDFRYQDKLYESKVLSITPNIFQGYTCPDTCGGCCRRFTLDYIPGEVRPDIVFRERTVEVNGSAFTIFTYDQHEDASGYTCHQLVEETGRCGIHGKHPFSCDFELLRFMVRSNRASLTTSLYQRGWSMRRVDGGRGAKCELTPCDEGVLNEIVRKLTRLKQWSDYLQISTYLDAVIAWVKRGPHYENLVLGKKEKRQGFFV